MGISKYGALIFRMRVLNHKRFKKQMKIHQIEKKIGGKINFFLATPFGLFRGGVSIIFQ